MAFFLSAHAFCSGGLIDILSDSSVSKLETSFDVIVSLKCLNQYFDFL